MTWDRAYAITLRFVTERGVLSGLINRGTGSLGFSHVGALTFDGREFGARDAVDHAPRGKPGVQFRPADYATFTREVRVAIPVTRAEGADFWNMARKIEGAPYSPRTILGFVVGRNVPELRDHVAFDCSTAMSWLLLHGPKLLAPALQPRLRQISPNELYGIAEQLAFDRRPR